MNTGELPFGPSFPRLKFPATIAIDEGEAVQLEGGALLGTVRAPVAIPARGRSYA